MQHLRDLAERIQQMKRNDKDLNCFFSRETQTLLEFIIRDCFIEVCDDEHDLSESPSSEQIIGFLQEKKAFPNDMANQLRQLINGCPAGGHMAVLRTLIEVVPPLVQLVKESFREQSEYKKHEGLWGIPEHIVPHFVEKVRAAMDNPLCTRIICELSRALTELCLQNRNGRRSEEIESLGSSLVINQLLDILAPFLQSGYELKLQKRIRRVGNCLTEIIDNLHASDNLATGYYARLTLAFLQFAELDPCNLVQFDIQSPSGGVEPLGKLTCDKSEESFSQAYKVTKGSEAEIELRCTAWVTMDGERFKAGAFQMEVSLTQDERERFEELQKNAEFSGIRTMMTEQLQQSQTLMTICSKQKTDFLNIAQILKNELHLEEEKFQIGRCPLAVRSCADHGNPLRLTLVYERGEKTITLESRDFVTCAEPNEKFSWSPLTKITTEKLFLSGKSCWVVPKLLNVTRSNEND